MPSIKVRTLLAASLLISLSGIVLAHACLILIYGQVQIYEHSKPGLVADIVILSGCFLFGLERLWASMK